MRIGVGISLVYLPPSATLMPTLTLDYIVIRPELVLLSSAAFVCFVQVVSGELKSAASLESHPESTQSTPRVNTLSVPAVTQSNIVKSSIQGKKSMHENYDVG